MNVRTRLLPLIFCIVLAGTAQAAEEHQQHDMHAAPTKKSAEFVVRATWPETVLANQQVALIIDVVDSAGQAVERFDVVHEKLLHLIVVANDLQYFNHIHPEYQGKGRFVVQTVLPSGGTYVFFCDYKPAGSAGQVATFAKQVAGPQPPTAPKATTASQVQGDTAINLAAGPIKAGKETTLAFELQQAVNGLPVHDLQPYLGAMGHLVIIREAAELTAAEYIHTHAMDGERHNLIPFMTVFPQPGWYKLFAQFNRDGDIVTAAFRVKAD